MRIVHWAEFPKPNMISGLFTSVKEIVEAELELGFEAGICDPLHPEGGMEIPLRRRTIKTMSMESVREDPDTVNFLSTGFFEGFYDLPNKVAILHGMPLHCIHVQLFMGRQAMETTINLAKMSDYSICWDRQATEFWKCVTPNVEYVERGCDLEFWKPGEKPKSRFRPIITYLEVLRPVKLPLTFLFAMKYVQQRPGMRDLRFNLGCIESRHQLLWWQIIDKLDLDQMAADYIIGVHLEPWVYYRSSDLMVSPCQKGLLSRVGVEALACGCPVVMLEGSKEKKATIKCKDTPLSMAKAIEKVWNRVQKDPDKVKAEARAIAEKHYDVKDTARRFIEIAENLVAPKGQVKPPSKT